MSGSTLAIPAPGLVDRDGDILVYALSGSPTGVTIDPVTVQ